LPFVRSGRPDKPICKWKAHIPGNVTYMSRAFPSWVLPDLTVTALPTSVLPNNESYLSPNCSTLKSWVSLSRNGSLSGRPGGLLMPPDWADPASSDKCKVYLGLTLKKRLRRTRKWSNAFTATKRGEKSLYRPFAYLTNYKWNISQVKAIMIGRSS